MFFSERYSATNCFAFAFKASHNHFARNQRPRVFNRSAPVVILNEEPSEHQWWGLFGVFNSSVTCFWLRENSQHQGGGAAAHPWSWTYEFSSSAVGDLPLPDMLPASVAQKIDSLATELESATPAAVCERGRPTRVGLDNAHARNRHLRNQMIALQEELDWESYNFYGLGGEVLTYQGDDLPEVEPGERAFEVKLAREGEQAAWFDFHGFERVISLPEHWPSTYRQTVEQRIRSIEADRSLKFLERPEYKRRWEEEPWREREQKALRRWLLDRLEDRRLWFDGQDRPLARSVAQVADEVARDSELVNVLTLWEGRPDVAVSDSLQRLLSDEAVPFLAALRYTDAGLRKRAEWERTWQLQRRKDAGEDISAIPVPPKYAQSSARKDFRSDSYWAARGKLDVPKERFIAYPDAERDTDPTPLLGWAGWDHAEQALALGRVITERESEGWSDERLVPLIAGLAELQPWVDQWHAELHPTYGVSLASFCDEELSRRCSQIGWTREQLAEWRPAPARRGRRRTASRSR